MISCDVVYIVGYPIDLEWVCFISGIMFGLSIYYMVSFYMGAKKK